MKRLKGQEGIKEFLGVAVFVAIIATLWLYLGNHLVRVEASIESAEDEMVVVDVAHMAKKCFSEDNIVLESLLTEKRLKECDIPHKYIRIRDKIDDNEWEFGEEKGDSEHEMFVAIKRDEEIHVGELYVRF